MSQEINDKLTEAMTINNLGTILKLTGNNLKSYNYFKESLLKMKNLGYQRGIAMNIASISEICFLTGDFKLSTLLLSFNNSIKKSMTTDDLLNIQKIKTKLRKKLSNDNFFKYWNDGASLTLKQATHLILKHEL